MTCRWFCTSIVATGSIFALADAVAFDLSPWPNVARWVATLKARPSWISAHAVFRQMSGQAPQAGALQPA